MAATDSTSRRANRPQSFGTSRSHSPRENTAMCRKTPVRIATRWAELLSRSITENDIKQKKQVAYINKAYSVFPTGADAMVCFPHTNRVRHTDSTKPPARPFHAHPRHQSKYTCGPRSLSSRNASFRPYTYIYDNVIVEGSACSVSEISLSDSDRRRNCTKGSDR